MVGQCIAGQINWTHLASHGITLPAVAVRINQTNNTPIHRKHLQDATNTVYIYIYLYTHTSPFPNTSPFFFFCGSRLAEHGQRRLSARRPVSEHMLLPIPGKPSRLGSGSSSATNAHAQLPPTPEHKFG